MSKEHTAEHLRIELKLLSDTLEEVLSSSDEKSEEELSKIRSKAKQALKQSRYRLGETGDTIAKQTRIVAAHADEYVRGNPWTGVGISAAIGVVFDVLLSRCQLWRTLIARKGPAKAFWALGSELFPSWLK